MFKSSLGLHQCGQDQTTNESVFYLPSHGCAQVSICTNTVDCTRKRAAFSIGALTVPSLLTLSSFQKLNPNHKSTTVLNKLKSGKNKCMVKQLLSFKDVKFKQRPQASSNYNHSLCLLLSSQACKKGGCKGGCLGFRCLPSQVTTTDGEVLLPRKYLDICLPVGSHE